MSTMGAIPNVNEMTYILSQPPQGSSNQPQMIVPPSGFIEKEPNVPEGPPNTQVPIQKGGPSRYVEVDEDAPPAREIVKEKSSLAYTSFNYINAIVGSGVIGMPYALHQAGFGLGILLLFVVGYVTDISLVLIIRSGRMADVTTYQDLVMATLGKPGFYVQSLLQFMYPVISLISYNIIVGDTLTKVIIRITGISAQSVVVRRDFIVVTTTLLITLPLSLYRNISRLAKISLISVLFILLIGIAMVYRLVTMIDMVPETSKSWSFVNDNMASAVGIMSFAFMCHHFSFLVYESLADNTQERWNKVTHISITASGLLSMVYAVSGYVTFTTFVQGDIFENYCWDDDLMNICRGLYAVTILLTFPIECFVAREVIENSFFRAYQPQPIFRHAALTVVISILVMLISLTTDCLGVVLEMNGIMCALPLAYIIPPLCYIRLEEGSLFARTKWKAWGVMIFGILTMLTGTVILLTNLEEHSKCSHGVEMNYCSEEINGTQVPIEITEPFSFTGST